MGHSARTIKDLLRLLPAVVRFLSGHFQDPRPRVESDQYQVHEKLCHGRLERVVQERDGDAPERRSFMLHDLSARSYVSPELTINERQEGVSQSA